MTPTDKAIELAARAIINAAWTDWDEPEFTDDDSPTISVVEGPTRGLALAALESGGKMMVADAWEKEAQSLSEMAEGVRDDGRRITLLELSSFYQKRAVELRTEVSDGE